MKQHSLGRRAVTVVLITEIVCAVVFSLTSLWHERRVRERALDVMLQGRSDSLLGAIQDAEDPADSVKIDPEELKLPAEDVWAVYDGGGQLIGESQNAPTDLISPGRVETRELRFHGRLYRVIQRLGLRIIDRDENGGLGFRRHVTLIYAVPTGHLFHEIREAAAFYTLLSLLLVCVTAAVLILSFRRLLQPLEELAANAAEVGKHSSFTAPQSALRIRELRPLAEALSLTIERLRHALSVEHRFISDAAHELKTAVAVVRSSVQLLTLRERSSDEYVHGLQRVLNDNQRVEQLVSRMLALGRFEEQSPDKDPSSLAGCISHTLDGLSSWITSRHVSVSANCDPGIEVAISNEALEILISNLVMNAVQHSPEGAEVRVSANCGTGSEVVFEVADQGSGIPSASLPHVFERFYRDDRSRSRQTGGAGLGLAICKSIVEGSGGTIQIESEPGQGTVVRATLRQARLVPHASSLESTLQA